MSKENLVSVPAIQSEGMRKQLIDSFHRDAYNQEFIASTPSLFPMKSIRTD